MTPISKVGTTVASSLPVVFLSLLQCHSYPTSPCLPLPYSDAIYSHLPQHSSEGQGPSHWTNVTPSPRSALGNGGSQKYTESGRLWR